MTVLRAELVDITTLRTELPQAPDVSEVVFACFGAEVLAAYIEALEQAA